MAQLIDKSALVAEIERKIKELEPFKTEDNLRAHGAIAGYYQILSFLRTLGVKEVDLDKSARYYLLHEHISQLNVVLHQADLKKVRKIKEWISKEQDGLMDANGNFEYPEHEGAYHILCNLDTYIDSLQEEPVSEDLIVATNNYCINVRKGYPRVMDETDRYICNAFKAGANWQKNHLWKDAQGDYLPEIDREVIAIIQDWDDAGICRVVFAHRPNPEGWDGKSISTGEVSHYEPQTYDKGGWNIPDVKFWLDVSLIDLEK